MVRCGEACDDGDGDPGDGCMPDCTVQLGWQCDDQEPSRCALGAMVILDVGAFIMGSPAFTNWSSLDDLLVLTSCAAIGGNG
ncbi:hypothetical protein ACFL6C_13595, partial [Myxococcota bacterium]